MSKTLKNNYKKIYNKDPKWIFSAPGRSELSGNHTDHQHGLILACAINLKSYAAVNTNEDNLIRINSKGFEPFIVDINDIEINNEEFGTSKSLIKGILAKFKSLNEEIKGLDIYMESEVLEGSGLSSSASFEVLFATILNHLFCDNKYSKVDLAKFSQYAENRYFGKPCGLMDQMAIAIGNIVYIDFKDIDNPLIEKLDFDLNNTDYSLCILDSGASHQNLNNEYADITKELKEVSIAFNKHYLRDVDENEFYNRMHELKEKFSDRAILRAIHVFNENNRVIKQKEALINNDFDFFLKLVEESGNSSYMYLQNVLINNEKRNQELALTIALAKQTLKDKGVVRVHGGGFAGTALAFVRNDFIDEFKETMNKYLGNNSCHLLTVNKDGSKLEEELK